MRQSMKAAAAPSVPDQDFVFQIGTSYADKDELATKALKFDVLAIDLEANAGFDGEDRWSVRVHAYDGRDEEVITLSSNEKRDEQMRSAQASIEAKGPLRNIRLRKIGRAYYLESAGKTS